MCSTTAPFWVATPLPADVRSKQRDWREIAAGWGFFDFFAVLWEGSERADAFEHLTIISIIDDLISWSIIDDLISWSIIDDLIWWSIYKYMFAFFCKTLDVFVMERSRMFGHSAPFSIDWHRCPRINAVWLDSMKATLFEMSRVETGWSTATDHGQIAVVPRIGSLASESCGSSLFWRLFWGPLKKGKLAAAVVYPYKLGDDSKGPPHWMVHHNIAYN